MSCLEYFLLESSLLTYWTLLRLSRVYMGRDRFFVFIIPIYYFVFTSSFFDLDILKYCIPISHHKQKVLKEFIVATYNIRDDYRNNLSSQVFWRDGFAKSTGWVRRLLDNPAKVCWLNSKVSWLNLKVCWLNS